jgi:hypothetical protein
MAKTEIKEDTTDKTPLTRIGVIPTCSNIKVPSSWNGKRVFCILKQEYDRMREQEQKEYQRVLGVFAGALAEEVSAKKNGR